ncbi:hypothetical protein B1759_12490 [Rubrivirga sp. SAORIC476]|uniref:hypothetical protein n=1 Tax=Rubrivirga sp. SAORIC476 TaxID=1961794 RepID=UPI000BA92B5E|nr:hypothetical protein [Rubrivirga sp. SAORIC476]PAP79166.1 hypothetical protein B1759_12490 [Rubrivirga sp. SAORIC476]
MLRLGLLLVLLAIGGCAASGDEAVAPSDVRTVHLAGRFETSYRGRPPRGAYGLRVYLLFRRSDGTGWEHAVPPSGRSRRHRTFDVLAEDGSFRFDLATADDLSAYNEVAVVPALQSDAVRLVPTPAGARTLDDTTTVLPLADAIRVPLSASGPVRAEALHAEVRPEVGVIVRYATLSREFVSALYDGAPPFDLPPVRVERSRGGGYVFQALDPDALALGGHEIELNVARGLSATLVGHEYGHYASFQMWGANPLRYTLRNRNLREGWAIFFSFAVRAYAAAQYGDVDLASSNPERAAFTDGIAGRARYQGIVYGTTHPDYAAIGALLWSLYDRAAPSPFEYEGDDLGSLAGDNDDIAGGVALVEAVRTTRTRLLAEAGIAEVVQTFRAAMPPGLRPSIDGAQDFFLCPAWPRCDVTASADASSRTASRTLRPVAPADLVARRVSAQAVALSWNPQTGAAPWANLPDAVQVLRNDAVVATLPCHTASWVDDDAGPGQVRYEVRAVGGGGVAHGGAEAEVEGVP